MKPYLSAIAFLVFTLLASFASRPKVRFIYIENELSTARSIQVVKVIAYTDSTMLFGLKNSKDTFVTGSRRKKSFLLSAADKTNESTAYSLKEIAGKWPDVGQSVLLVRDSANYVQLFAFLQDNSYRFWDPNSIPFANSIFIFPKKTPYKALPVCWQVLSDTSEYQSCADGCLVEKNAIKYR